MAEENKSWTRDIIARMLGDDYKPLKPKEKKTLFDLFETKGDEDNAK